MKKLNRTIIKTFTLLLFVAFITACGNNRQIHNQEHGEMMEGENHMDGEDNDHTSGDNEMMMDSTSTQMEENEDMMQ